MRMGVDVCVCGGSFFDEPSKRRYPHHVRKEISGQSMRNACVHRGFSFYTQA